ncbi:hypothetical protein [Rubritalea tangerina]|uniref:hypothetical protein n=1 Tax=Rubritalea tangerina TaxID=430798 RepID=UPI003613ACDF
MEGDSEGEEGEEKAFHGIWEDSVKWSKQGMKKCQSSAMWTQSKRFENPESGREDTVLKDRGYEVSQLNHFFSLKSFRLLVWFLQLPRVGYATLGLEPKPR